MRQPNRALKKCVLINYSLSGPPSWVTASTNLSWSSEVHRSRGFGSDVKTKHGSPIMFPSSIIDPLLYSPPSSGSEWIPEYIFPGKSSDPSKEFSWEISVTRLTDKRVSGAPKVMGGFGYVFEIGVACICILMEGRERERERRQKCLVVYCLQVLSLSLCTFSLSRLPLFSL